RSAGPYRSLEALNMPPLGILASPDSSKILVYCASLAGSDLFIDVVDRRLDRIWSKEEQIRPGGALELQSMGVTDRGNVFFAYTSGLGGKRAGISARTPAGNPVRLPDRTRDRKEDFPASHIGICNPDGAFSDREFRLANGFPVSVSLLNVKDGDDMAITGTWSDKPDYLSGVYEARIDAARGKITQIREIPFPDTLIKKISCTRTCRLTRRPRYRGPVLCLSLE
ncbi:MAG: hypothetical protein Q8932_21600, partial [Bacteroidota bacterium]|nr:hypothetical protein [Bacteroidota bacterium]